jgi:hypothetical protein
MLTAWLRQNPLAGAPACEPAARWREPGPWRQAYLYECTGKKLYERLVCMRCVCDTIRGNIKLCRRGFRT